MNYVILNNNKEISSKSIFKLYPGVTADNLSLYIFADFDQEENTVYTCKLVFKRQDGLVIGDCSTNVVTATNPVTNQSERARKFSWSNTSVLKIPGEVEVSIKYSTSTTGVTVAKTCFTVNDAPDSSELASIETNQANITILDAKIDVEIDKVKDGTYTAKKAEQDEDGNNIKNTYATKAQNTIIDNRTKVYLTADANGYVYVNEVEES
jgi:hypothetical protein